MNTDPKARDLFIVDNSISGWTGLRYLEEWAGIAKGFDVATGYFEIGSLLSLDGKWQGLDKIRILMGGEITYRTRKLMLDAVKALALKHLDANIEADKDANPFLRGVPAILATLQSGQIECRVYDKNKFHAKAYITHAKLEVVGSQALVGSSNFTRPGLTENIELNVQIQSAREVAQLQEWFEAHWNEATEVTEAVVETISRQIRPYTPFDVYAKALQEFFRGHELTETEWDETKSKMFPALDRYQKEAYWALMKIARQHGGAFLCDGVGLGKTFVGLMLIERLVLHEGKRVVLFAPKAAKESVWEPHLRAYLSHIGGIGGSADFSNLAVFSHTDLGRIGDTLFRDLAVRGSKLVALHLMETRQIGRLVTTYNGPRNPEVGRVDWSDDTVWLDAIAPKRNEPSKGGSIGFRGVSHDVWNFHIGGYQVCEKWLKDRKGRTLSNDDIAHYEKIVVAISETILLMKEIDEVIEAHGGWPGAFQTGEDKAAKLMPFRIVAQPAAGDRYVTCVPLVPLKVAAGRFGDPQHVVDDGWDWVEVKTNHRLRAGMFVAQVVGRSMEPQIPDGGWCLFASPVTGTRQGKTVLVQLRDATDPETGERYTVKRYVSEKVGVDDSWHHARITLRPLNPDFAPIVLTDDDEGVLQVVAEFLEVLTTPPTDSSLQRHKEEAAPPEPPATKRASHASGAQRSFLDPVAESLSEETQKRIDAEQLKRASGKQASEDTNPEPRRPLTNQLNDQFEVEDVLAIIRDVVSSADPMPREDAIKDIATQLGAGRVGARIRGFIEGMLNTASRRFIIEARDGGLVACTRSIDDYHRDFLKTALKAVIGHTWTDEDEAIRAATRYLGFRRTGPKISKAFKSAINGLLRQNELQRDGSVLRRPNQ